MNTYQALVVDVAASLLAVASTEDGGQGAVEAQKRVAVAASRLLGTGALAGTAGRRGVVGGLWSRSRLSRGRRGALFCSKEKSVGMCRDERQFNH